MTEGPIGERDDNDLGPDLESCTHPSHCHRARSPRQEDGVTADGRRRACHRPAGWGTDHVGSGACKLHGGNTRNGIVNAQREIAQRAVQTYGLPVETTPAQALIDELHRTAGHVAWLGVQVAALRPDELVYGIAEETVDPDIVDADQNAITNTVTTKYKAQPHALLVQYEKERRHLANVAKIAIDAGVSERIANVIEQTAETYMGIWMRILDRLDLTDAQRAAVPAAVVQEFTPYAEGV